MKQILIPIAAVAFSILFFEQTIGLNLSLFAILTLGVLAYLNPNRFKNPKTIMYALAYLFTAILVFITNSGLSILANTIAFLTLVGNMSEAKTSIYVTWLNGLYTTIAGFFHRSFRNDKTEDKADWWTNFDALHWAKLIGIPLLFVIVFTLLYKSGNPVFDNIISDISFDFVNFRWLLFTGLGYYLFQNITQPVQVQPATSEDLATSSNLALSENYSEEKLKKEKQLGTTLFWILNALILFYIITDIIALMGFESENPVDYSAMVHDGINTLIASIVIAISIIIYFFRGDLNFYADNKILKNLSYLWMGLNMVLIVLIAIKNLNYISSFGLTYRRIGVNVYILLTLFGLITTFLKVLQIKNTVFLFRVNIQIAFVGLVVLSAINWDYYITQYNLTRISNYDVKYLIRLSERNATILYKYRDALDITDIDRERIETKYHAYLKKAQENSWQSKTYAAFTLNSNTAIH